MTLSSPSPRRRSAMLVGWLAGVVLAAAVLVLAPMVDTLDQSYLLPIHWQLLLVLAGLVSAGGVVVLRGGVRRALGWAVAMPLGILCSYLIRVAIDGAHDPTDHNLLPFELIIDFIAALKYCLVGAAIGYIVRRQIDRADAEQPWQPSWKRDKRR